MHFVESHILTCLWHNGSPMLILTDVVSCCNLQMYIQEVHQRTGPAIGGYPVNWDVDTVLVMFFFFVELTAAAVCLSPMDCPLCKDRRMEVQRQNWGFLTGIILQFSPTYKVPNLPRRFRLQSQAFPRATLTSVEPWKRNFPHGLWAAEPHFPFLFSLGERNSKHLTE